MVVTARRLTADEFLALPPERNTQLIDGEIVVNDPSFRHQRIQGELHRLLVNWLLDHPGHGEACIGCNFRIDGRNVFVPDLWWVPEERRPAWDAVFYGGPPNLVAEVRSPSTWRYDVGKKRLRYEQAGLAELWLVDIEADTVLVYRGEEALELGRGQELTTPQIPGFGIDLTGLFDR